MFNVPNMRCDSETRIFCGSYTCSDVERTTVDETDFPYPVTV